MPAFSNSVAKPVLTEPGGQQVMLILGPLPERMPLLIIEPKGSRF